jgi:hypothetical protein
MTASQIKQKATNKRTVRFLMFDVSPDAANFWFDISNLALLAGAVLVAMGTYGTIKFSGVKEKFADERIAANELETKRAIADSDIAKQAASEANARAAEARLALEKFKAPRLLSLEQMASISKRVPNLPMNSVTVGATEISVEAIALAEQIFKILSMSGLRPHANNAFASNNFGIFTGVLIQFTTGNDSSERIAETLSEALNAEGIATKSVGGLHESAFAGRGFDRTSAGARNLLIAIGEKPK